MTSVDSSSGVRAHTRRLIPGQDLVTCRPGGKFRGRELKVKIREGSLSPSRVTLQGEGGNWASMRGDTGGFAAAAAGRRNSCET